MSVRAPVIGRAAAELVCEGRTRNRAEVIGDLGEELTQAVLERAAALVLVHGRNDSVGRGLRELREAVIDALVWVIDAPASRGRRGCVARDFLCLF